jgi:hypothetical protein
MKGPLEGVQRGDEEQTESQSGGYTDSDSPRCLPPIHLKPPVPDAQAKAVVRLVHLRG